MDYQEIRSAVLDFCEASFIEVFQNQGCLIFRATDASCVPSSRPVVIDAKAPELELVMSLSISEDVLSASYPDKSDENIQSLDAGLLSDWHKELSNRVMGSLKNRVGIATSPMTLGIPKEFVSDDVFKGFDVETFMFEFEGNIFACKLGIRVLGTIESLEQSEVDSMDGELEFF